MSTNERVAQSLASWCARLADRQIACPLCGSQLFLHSPLTLAGVMTREVLVPQMYKRL